MSIRTRHLFTSAILAAALCASPAHAQMAVHDPINYAQNLLQASRALEQIRNQIRQIEQSTQMLRQNPLQLSPELSQSIAQARDLFASAQGLAFDVDRIGDNIRTQYPETWERFKLEDMLNQSDRWMEESRASLARAMEAQSRAAQSIERTRGQINRALQSSHASEGQTGAIQAGNQLLGIQAAQLSEIHTLLIAQGRALETERMERLAREERAKEIQRRAFPKDTTAPTSPARTAFGN